MERGKRLETALQMLGVGQAYLASLWGVSQAAISKKIQGKSDISYDQALALQHDKFISVEWLMQGTGEMYLNAVSEESGAYVTRLDITDAAITRRFIAQLDGWHGEHSNMRCV